MSNEKQNWFAEHKLLTVILAVIGLGIIGGATVASNSTKNNQPSATKTAQPVQATKPTDSSPNAVKQAVISYSNAYLGGHGNAAYNLLSKRCASQTTANEMVSLALLANQAYGDLQPTNITAKILGVGKATASYSYPTASTINKQDQSWIYEQGSWRYDGCTD